MKHEVIVTYMIKEPYCIGTIKAYDIKGFIEMCDHEGKYPLVKAIVNGTTYTEANFKTVRELINYFGNSKPRQMTIDEMLGA